ncbi:MAG: PDZ domain-containing protein [Roseiflexaceae bacterium]
MLTYTISMPEPQTHRFHVALHISDLNGPTLELALPVWTPGSYMVRDYARHVQQFRAIAAGEPLPWQKQDKTTWIVQTNGASEIEVHYQVYAFELTVRTSHLDETHGYFNPATLCLFVPGQTEQPHVVVIDPPAGWRVATGLPSSTTNRFEAEDYDHLVDSPFEIGTHRLLTFEVEGKLHEIAIWGTGNEDETRLINDTKRIVEATRALFPEPLPYDRYLFILHLADGLYGGLEHRNSVTNLIDRWTFQPERSYERYLGLTSHEYYHVWNVKRIRPTPLGPFDYRRENYTRQLWVSEGVTSYYDNLILARGGLISTERYLDTLADDIVTLQGQPGRALQSLAQSSFDAWIKLYRPDENSTNSSISYYLKGSLVALLLDLEIRQRSGGARSLDDVLRYLYCEVYGGSDRDRLYDAPGFAEDGGFLAAVEAVAGSEGGFYRHFLQRFVETTEELPYEQGFGYVGVQVQWSRKSNGGWLGLKSKVDQGRLKVTSVVAGGPAEQAAIAAGDELIALDGFRIDEAKLAARLSERAPGSSAQITLFRGDRLLTTNVTLRESPFDALRLIPHQEATAAQQAMFRSWVSE